MDLRRQDSGTGVGGMGVWDGSGDLPGSDDLGVGDQKPLKPGGLDWQCAGRLFTVALGVGLAVFAAWWRGPARTVAGATNPAATITVN